MTIKTSIKENRCKYFYSPGYDDTFYFLVSINVYGIPFLTISEYPCQGLNSLFLYLLLNMTCQNFFYCFIRMKVIKIIKEFNNQGMKVQIRRAFESYSFLSSKKTLKRLTGSV